MLPLRLTRALCTKVWRLSVDRRWKVFYKKSKSLEINVLFAHIFTHCTIMASFDLFLYVGYVYQ